MSEQNNNMKTAEENTVTVGACSSSCCCVHLFHFDIRKTCSICTAFVFDATILIDSHFYQCIPNFHFSSWNFRSTLHYDNNENDDEDKLHSTHPYNESNHLLIFNFSRLQKRQQNSSRIFQLHIHGSHTLISFDFSLIWWISYNCHESYLLALPVILSP